MEVHRLLFTLDQEVEMAELMAANLIAVQSRYCDDMRIHSKNMATLVKKMKTMLRSTHCSHLNSEPPPADLVPTPQWISDLSTMADEVRDRTILVKFTHYWSDREIRSFFFEIGIIDEVKYLPTGSGFHSQVRFQTTYESEGAYCYYNDRVVHEGCCAMELHHPEDVITWNNQRIAGVLCGIRDTLKMRSTVCLVKESLIKEEMLSLPAASTQIQTRTEPNLGQESSYSTGHLFDKMPGPIGDTTVLKTETPDLDDDKTETTDLEGDKTKTHSSPPTSFTPVTLFNMGTSVHQEVLVDYEKQELKSESSMVIPNLLSMFILKNEMVQNVAYVLPFVNSEGDLGSKLVDSLDISSAHQVFDKMPSHGITVVDSFGLVDSIKSFVFDPGKTYELGMTWLSVQLQGVVGLVECGNRIEMRLTFDPGIITWSICCFPSADSPSLKPLVAQLI